jgi:hypothetical protein
VVPTSRKGREKWGTHALLMPARSEARPPAVRPALTITVSETNIATKNREDRMTISLDRSVNDSKTHVARESAGGSRDHHRAYRRAARDDGCHVRIADHAKLRGGDAVERDGGCSC